MKRRLPVTCIVNSKKDGKDLVLVIFWTSRGSDHQIIWQKPWLHWKTGSNGGKFCQDRSIQRLQGKSGQARLPGTSRWILAGNSLQAALEKTCPHIPKFKQKNGKHLQSIHFFKTNLRGGIRDRRSRWCQLKYFLFSPLIHGEMIQVDEHIFQMGWELNHQLDITRFRYLLESQGKPYF